MIKNLAKGVRPAFCQLYLHASKLPAHATSPFSLISTNLDHQRLCRTGSVELRPLKASERSETARFRSKTVMPRADSHRLPACTACLPLPAALSLSYLATPRAVFASFWLCEIASATPQPPRA